MKKGLSLAVALMIILSAYAQDYKFAAGFRLSPTIGVTGKLMLNERAAVELLAATRLKGYKFTGLFEWHNRFKNEKLARVSWYFGGGAHYGLWQDFSNVTTIEIVRISIVGFDAIIGAEYTFENIPLNISADWKPAFDLKINEGWIDEAALSIRYYF